MKRIVGIDPGISGAFALLVDGQIEQIIDMPTIKPIDAAALEGASRETGRILVAEEHLSHGGLGSAVAMAVGATHPCRLGFVNLGDRFAEDLDTLGLQVLEVRQVCQVCQVCQVLEGQADAGQR